MPRRRMRVPLALTAVLLVASSCAPDANTHVVVVMDTDYVVPTEIDRIGIRVLKVSDDGSDEIETWSKEFPLATEDVSDSGRYSLPASFSVVPVAADMKREVVIEAEGSLGDDLVVARRVRTGFIRGQFLVLRMFLYRACADAACPAGQSCGCTRASACASPTCVDERVPPEDLEVTSDPGTLPPSSGIPTPCEPGRTICGDECVDVASDPRFCGGCDNACPNGTVCTAGRCIDPADCRVAGAGCQGFTYCDQAVGNCVRGCAIDEQCGSDEVCNVDTHECACVPNLTRCPPVIGNCVDVQTDLSYCGDCDTFCPRNNVCDEATCVDLGDCRVNGVGCSGFSYCDEGSGDCVRGCLLDDQCGGANEFCNTEINDCVCEDGFQRCPSMVGACIDPQTDLLHCGGCDTSCATGEVCQEGVCYDPDCRTNAMGCSGFTYCSDDTGECLPGCDRDEQCTEPNESCNVTSHTCVCDSGLTRCDGECVNTAFNRRNCGDCGEDCRGNEICWFGDCIGSRDD